MSDINTWALDRELKRGSAELLILSLLDARPRHGYELSKLIHARSGGQLTFHIDSLYPLLYRLEERGWIKGTWVEKADERRRRFYCGHARRTRSARTAAQDLGGLRGGGAPRDGRRPCLTLRLRRDDESLRASNGLREVRTRLSSLRLSPTREAEIVDELSQHLDERYRELISGGAAPDEASRLALAEFRSNEMLAQQMAPLRQSRVDPPLTPAAPTGRVLGDLLQDLRYAVRIFRKQTAFAATAVLTLALGIGATTAIFSVVYGVLLKPLPFAEPEALVSLRQHAPHGAGTNHGPTTYLTYRENQSAFEAIGAWDPTDVSITGAGDPERVQALLVSSSTLPLLRVQPVVGRGFGADDDTPGQPLRVVLTHGYWQRRFGGAENAIGQRISIDGRSAEVIGVLPSSFTFLRTSPSVLLPMPLDAAAPRGISFGFQALARLKPGVTLARANDDIARMISLLPPSFARLELQPNVQALSSEVIGDVAEMLWILLAAVAVVLLIACGNVANLFLVRAEGRHQELAMRAALGASRGRIARVLLSESLVLALAGGAVGMALAEGAIGLLRTIAPAELPRVNDIDLNVTVLLFTLAVSLLSGLLFGVFAVLRFGQPDGHGAQGGRPVVERRARAASDPQRAGRGTGGVGADAADRLGPDDSNVPRHATGRSRLHAARAGPDLRRRHPSKLHQPIPSRRHGRTNASPNNSLDSRGSRRLGSRRRSRWTARTTASYLMVEGFPIRRGRLPLRRFKSFAPGYLETMGARLVAGRSITWSEVHEQRLVVSSPRPSRASTGRRLREAIGKRVRCCNTKMPWREIVGVVGDERDDGLNRPPTPIVYFPILNESSGGGRWRTRCGRAASGRRAFSARSSRRCGRSIAICRWRESRRWPRSRRTR